MVHVFQNLLGMKSMQKLKKKMVIYLIPHLIKYLLIDKVSIFEFFFFFSFSLKYGRRSITFYLLFLIYFSLLHFFGNIHGLVENLLLSYLFSKFIS